MKLTSFVSLKIFMLFIMISLLLNGCQDPILVGGDLLDDEKINVDVINDFDITTTTVAGIPVITKSTRSKFFRLGEINDEVYGRTLAEMYLKFGFSGSIVPSYITDTVSRFDSLVLVLKYDSLASYAGASGLQTVRMYQLEEAYKSADTFYSDTKLNYIPIPIFEKNININPKDSISVVVHATGKVVRQAPQMRLRLDDALGKSIFDNKDIIKDSLFRDFFKGIYITSKSADNNSFLYGFDLSSTAISPTNLYNKLIMYYTVSDTIKKTYEFIIDNAVINRYDHDYTGSVAERFINQPETGDSLTFTEGIGGVKTGIKFNDLDKAKGLLINKAELEFFIADIPVSNKYKKPTQLVALVKNQNGRYEFISDISNGLVIENVFPAFGGFLERTTNGHRYRMNVTNYVKRAILDSNFNDTIYISVLGESENPDRSVFYGAGHSMFPVKLNVYYTKN